jgi:hypothetical protein
VFEIRPVRGDDMAYPGVGIGGSHNVHRVCLDIQHKATRVRTIRRVNLDHFAIHDSAHHFGAGDPALQEALERVLVPLDLSLRCSSTQNVDVETLSRIRSPSGSLQSTRQGAAFDGARLAFSGQGSRPRQTLL